MGDKWSDGGWEKGPEHGFHAVHRVRRDKHGEIVVEEYFERSLYVMLVGYPIAAVALWFCQGSADGRLRIGLIILTVLVSLYAAYLVFITWLVRLVGNVLERLSDSL